VLRPPIPLCPPQQVPERRDVPRHVAPRDGFGLTHSTAPGVAGAKTHRDAGGRESLQGRRGRSVNHGMTQRRHQHTGTQADRTGALGSQRQAHPHIGALLRRVVQPCARESELLGKLYVLGGVERCCECDGDLGR
jgi:hypothetical protein